MCAKRGGPVNPDHVKVQFRVVPPSLSLAWKVPVAPVPLGGTSLKGGKFGGEAVRPVIILRVHVHTRNESRRERKSYCDCDLASEIFL